MDIFASDRIKPSNIKFPKGFDKTEWHHSPNYEAFTKAMEDNTVGTVVLDSAASGDFNALKCAKTITEITCDKHTRLPTVLIIGNDAEMKKRVEDHIANSKRWVDLNRGK